MSVVEVTHDMQRDILHDDGALAKGNQVCVLCFPYAIHEPCLLVISQGLAHTVRLPHLPNHTYIYTNTNSSKTGLIDRKS
jgi:hypothetical protein